MTTSPGETPHRRGAAVRRGLLVLVALLAWFAVAGVGGPLVGRLSEVQTNDNASVLPSDAEATTVEHLSAGFSEASTLPYFVVLSRASGLTDADRQFAGRLAAELPGLRMAPLGDQGRTYRLGDFLAPGPVVPVPSEDGDAVLLVVSLDGDRADEVLDGGDSAVSVVADAMRQRLGQAPAGLATHITGPGGIVADLVTAFSGIDGKLLGVALLAVFVILLLVYRSPVLPFAVLLTSLVGLSGAALVVFHLARAGTITVSGMTQGILFILVVGAATDYSLLLVSRYREELHDERSALAAMRRAWRGSLPPIAASAMTVVLGLLCLSLSKLGSTRSLGPVGALGIVGALLAALTFLPVVLLVGRWVFWPKIPHVDHQHSADAVGERGVWGRVAGLVGRRPRTVWVVTALCLAAAAAFVPTFQASGVSQTDTFRTQVDSVVGQRVLSRHFPGGSGSPAIIIAPQDSLGAVLDVVRRTDGVAQVSVLPADQSAASGGQPGAAAEPDPKVVDGKVEVRAVLQAAADTPRAQDVVKRLRTSLDAVGPDALVGGQSAINLDVRTATDRDLTVIVPAVLAVILVVLALLLQSLVAPLLLVVANVLSFGATIGISALVFNHLLDLPGADPAIPLYAFVFLVALGIDYSIFLMTRVHEESRSRGTRPGVLVGLAVTGGVITSAGVVLAATFGALATLPLLFLLQIAFIVAFGVLLDTIVVRSLLVPALSYDSGRHVWWPSRLSRSEPHAPGSTRGSTRSSTAASPSRRTT
ncbi:MAG TPA: MMPL family transporter [Actinomycetales bacterium]|nr:MMPL family transporter [Actinomycetales bacterium]